MPLYEYRCEAGHKYEIRQPFGTPSEQPCEKCGKPARRVLHARPLLFKGSGFYSTDSRGSTNGRRRATPKSEGDAKTETTAEPAKAEKRAEKAADITSKAPKSSGKKK